MSVARFYSGCMATTFEFNSDASTVGTVVRSTAPAQLTAEDGARWAVRNLALPGSVKVSVKEHWLTDDNGIGYFEHRIRSTRVEIGDISFPARTLFQRHERAEARQQWKQISRQWESRVAAAVQDVQPASAWVCRVDSPVEQYLSYTMNTGNDVTADDVARAIAVDRSVGTSGLRVVPDPRHAGEYVIYTDRGSNVGALCLEDRSSMSMYVGKIPVSHRYATISASVDGSVSRSDIGRLSQQIDSWCHGSALA